MFKLDIKNPQDLKDIDLATKTLTFKDGSKKGFYVRESCGELLNGDNRFFTKQCNITKEICTTKLRTPPQNCLDKDEGELLAKSIKNLQDKIKKHN